MRKRILAIILSIALMLTVAVPIASAEPAVEEGLVFGYDFSTVDGTTVKDLSANGYDGTLRGTASVSDLSLIHIYFSSSAAVLPVLSNMLTICIPGN